jgi:hypothetical protein
MKKLLVFALAFVIALPVMAQDYDAQAFALNAQQRIRALAPTVVTPGLQVIPPGLGFVQPAGCTLSIYRERAGVYSTPFDPKCVIPAAVFATTPIYVRVGGSDGTTCGASEAGACASCWQALKNGNATSAPFMVAIRAGLYDRTHDCTDSAAASGGTAGAMVATQPAAIVGYGGPVAMGPIRLVTWAKDATYTNSYSGAGANTSGVRDPLTLDAYGNFTGCANYASASALDGAALKAGTCGWAQGGSTLYARFADGRAPLADASNVRVYTLGTRCLTFGTVSLYVSGIDCEGGVGTADATAVATRNIAIEDSSFRYAGSEIAGATARNVISANHTTGYIILARVVAAVASADLFNFHDDPATTGGTDYVGQSYVVTIDCVGNTAGMVGSPSDNDHTGHDNVIGIDINGKYSLAGGGAVRWIGKSRLALFGTQAIADRGDRDFQDSGEISTGFQTDDTAEMWAQETSSIRNSRTYVANTTGAKIHLRNPIGSGRLPSGSGTVDSY